MVWKPSWDLALYSSLLVGEGDSEACERIRGSNLALPPSHPLGPSYPSLVTSKLNYQNVPSSPGGLLFFKVGQSLLLSQSIWTDLRTVGL